MQDSEHTLYTVNLPENQYQCIPMYLGEVQFFSDFVSYNLLMPSGLLHPNFSDQRKKKKNKQKNKNKGV